MINTLTAAASFDVAEPLRGYEYAGFINMKKGCSENIKMRPLNNMSDNVKPRVAPPRNASDPLYHLSLIVSDHGGLACPLALFSPHCRLIETVGTDGLMQSFYADYFASTSIVMHLR
jgi:hypothetical protein